jgi:hypothetical protein
MRGDIVPRQQLMTRRSVLLAAAVTAPLVTFRAVRGQDPAPDAGILLGESKTQRWQVGLMVTAPDGACLGTFATLPVPGDWPEQAVREIGREMSPHVTGVQLRRLSSNGKPIRPSKRGSSTVQDEGVTQLLVSIGTIPARQTAQVTLTFEVTRRAILAPNDTSIYRIPKRPPSSVSIFLGPSPYIESRDDEIKDLAREITRDKENDWQKAEAIFDWVRANVEYVNGDLKGALKALRDKNGDCEELTSLFIALCRASDIPARTVWIPDHCYPEFYLEDGDRNGHWFPCEMTGGRFFGSMPATKPVLQKGDNFKVPEKRTPQRYVAEFLKVKAVAGTGDPEVRFVRKLLDE